MFDDQQLFSSAQVVVADAYSTNAVSVAKTPADGLWIGVTFVGADYTSVLVKVLAKASDAAWDHTAAAQLIAQKNITMASDGKGPHFIHVQSKLAYLKLYYDITGGTTATVTAGVVSGPSRDATA